MPESNDQDPELGRLLELLERVASGSGAVADQLSASEWHELRDEAAAAALRFKPGKPITGSEEPVMDALTVIHWEGGRHTGIVTRHLSQVSCEECLQSVARQGLEAAQLLHERGRAAFPDYHHGFASLFTMSPSEWSDFRQACMVQTGRTLSLDGIKQLIRDSARLRKTAFGDPDPNVSARMLAAFGELANAIDGAARAGYRLACEDTCQDAELRSHALAEKITELQRARCGPSWPDCPVHPELRRDVEGDAR